MDPVDPDPQFYFAPTIDDKWRFFEKTWQMLTKNDLLQLY